MKRRLALQPEDKLSIERWMNEGGHLATEAMIDREMDTPPPASVPAVTVEKH